MNTQNKLTGYPSIDKPWLKYYSEEAINAPLPECTIYEYLWENNKNYSNDPAIRYMNRTISYKEFFAGIDKAANAFYGLGIREGDIVMGITPSFPEIIYSFYGLNKIGAVSDWFDPRTSPSIIADEMRSTKTKAVLIFEDFIDSFAEMLKEFSCPIIVVSAVDSLPTPMKLIASAKPKKKLPSGWIRYADFVKKYSGTNVTEIVGRADSSALMEHTGGTTGQPKAVVLTNMNINAIAFQYKIGGTPIQRGESWLAVAYPFIAYLIIASHHLPLSLGLICELCFSIQSGDLEKALLKGKCNHMANTPVLWKHISKSRLWDGVDMSFLINPTVGADTLDVSEEREINKFLKAHGCKYNIVKGYGMTEVGSAVSVGISNECNKEGSVGIPFIKMLVTAVDLETNEELKCGEQGEICISGPSVMKEYYNNSAETSHVLRKHSDCRIWMHSGDLGYIDEDGFVFINGRLKRMIINNIGFKIFAPQIEKVISEIPSVDKCCVVGAPDKVNGNGQIAVAYIILSNGASEDIELLQEECAKKLPDYCVPQRFVFVKEFPYTWAAKVDYRKLEQMTESKI